MSCRTLDKTSCKLEEQATVCGSILDNGAILSYGANYKHWKLATCALCSLGSYCFGNCLTINFM